MSRYRVVGQLDGADIPSYVWKDTTDDIQLAEERLALAKQRASYTPIDIHENIGGQHINWRIIEVQVESDYTRLRPPVQALPGRTPQGAEGSRC